MLEAGLKISVITVAYNAEATIGDTLDSVAAQTGADFEHIVVDGNSSDNTMEIVKSKAHDRLRWISEPDNGLYNAMNKGAQLATGDVFGFLNADDIYADPSVLAQITSTFREGAVDACYADLAYVSQDNKTVLRYWKSRQFRIGNFALGWCPAHPTFYLRKSVVEPLGYFDESFRLAADGELMMRYLEVNEISSRYIPRVWVRMRVGGQTGQTKNIYWQNKELFRALRKNNIPFSPVKFVVSKIINRIFQLGAARMKAVPWLRMRPSDDS